MGPNHINDQPDSMSPQVKDSIDRDLEATRAQKKAHIRKGKHVLPPNKLKLGRHLTFIDELERAYGKISKLPIMSSKCIHPPTLETLNIKDEVLNLINNIGWAPYFEDTILAYVELVLEFYTTFEF